jgi:hypothetical protein
VTCAPHEIVQCVCCLRFLSKRDPGTIRVTTSEYNVPGIVHAGMDAVPDLFLHQAAILQRQRVYICFICEPHVKRAQQEHSAGNTSAVACSFLQDALECVLRGRMARVDFFCVLKGCICLAAHVRTPRQTYYHPLRSAACDVLEGVVALMLALSRAGGELGHEFAWGDQAQAGSDKVSLRRMPPIEEIIALARAWHSGNLAFPVQTQTDSQDALASAACLRRALRNPDLAAVVAEHAARARGVAYCAGCTDVIADYERAETPRYDRAVLVPWERVRPFATHQVKPAECAPEPLRLVYCCNCDSVQLRSFAFYRMVLSVEFPEEFRIACPRTFYSLALQHRRLPLG